MSKHTPGPWAADETRVRKGGELLVSVWDHGMPSPDDRLPGESWIDAMTRIRPDRDECRARSHANARLIAAAPELLEALESVMPYLDDYDDAGPDGLSYKSDKLWGVILTAKEVIAKAKGE